MIYNESGAFEALEGLGLQAVVAYLFSLELSLACEKDKQSSSCLLYFLPPPSGVRFKYKSESGDSVAV